MLTPYGLRFPKVGLGKVMFTSYDLRGPGEEERIKGIVAQLLD